MTVLGDFRGDEILAYFGYPRAHEDDAERTVRAALDIIAAVARLERPVPEPLAVRIGIATGLVVVGDLSREAALWEHALVGDTSNPAVDHIHFRAYAKRQSAAASGRLTLSSGLRSAATP